MPAGLDGNPDPIRSARRDQLLDELVVRIASIQAQSTVLVGVDGEGGTGKSTLADELAQWLRKAGRTVVRSTTDSFHNPSAVRAKRGRWSPEGYFLDSHNLGALKTLLLDPFSQGKPFKVACFDAPSDQPVEAPTESAPAGAILVFDGLFLHRPELRPYWAYSVFLRSTSRLQKRRAAWAATAPPETVDAFKRRYGEGWQLYIKKCDPIACANCLIDNDDFSAPYLVEEP